MTLTLRKNGNMLPTLMSDFFEGDKLFNADLLTLENNMMKWFDLDAKVPSANVLETEKEFKVELAAPGMEKKDFKVEMDNGCLVISAEKKEEKKEEKNNYTRREFSYNAFSRKFVLPDNILPEKIDAKYDNGILHLVLPKKEITISKPKKEIKVS